LFNKYQKGGYVNFYKYVMGAALLCSTQMAFANWSMGYESCDTCCDKSYNVYADYLYWEITRTDLDGDNGSDVDYLCPGYHSGFRVGGIAEFNCFDVGVRYTSFNGSASKDFFEYTAKFKFDYDVVDIEVGHAFKLDCADVAIRPFVGAKLAWVDQSFDTFSNNRVKQDFKGYGLLLGFDSKWNVYEWNRCNTCMPISLVVRGSVSILRAERTEHTGGEVEFRRHESCHYTPIFEGFAGLNLDYQSDCYGLFNVLVGYEVQSWQGLHRFDDNDETVSIGLGGLVVRLGYSF
jgi:hypothetical protein